MATAEILLPQSILLTSQRIRSTHRKPNNSPARKALPAAAAAAAAAAATTRKHHGGRPSSSGKVTYAAPARSAVQVYAGPAFSAASPEPSSLPLPQFMCKKAINDDATRNLRRILRLE